MTDVELRRARWRRVLETMALDETERADFGALGLGRRVAIRTVRAVLLPADPEIEVLRFDDAWWEWFEDHKSIEVAGRPIRLGERAHPTAHAAVMAREHGGAHPWNSYLAVHRNGTVELELGDLGGWERKDRENNIVRQVNLISVVGYVWAMGLFAREHIDHANVVGPFHLSLAVFKTRGALLGNVGEGWAETHSFENNVAGGQDDQLLWHWEFTDLPEADDLQTLAFSVGDRLEDAWGVPQRRYIDRHGQREGEFDARRVAT